MPGSYSNHLSTLIVDALPDVSLKDILIWAAGPLLFYWKARLMEEIEVEGKLLRAGKSIGVASIDFRNKKTGKLIAQGRHTKYLAASSRL